MPRSLFGGSYLVPDPPDFNWEALENASGLTFTQPQRAVLVAAMHRYLRNLREERTSARPKDVKHRCDRIHKHARALVNLLSLHVKNAPSDDYEINLNQAVFSLFPLNIDRDLYIRLLIQLDLGARVALRRLREEGQPGRQDKECLEAIIRAWHVVYKQAGGKATGYTRSGSASKATGPSLDLIDLALQQVVTRSPDSPIKDDIPPTRDALAQRIRAALKRPLVRLAWDEKSFEIETF
jgi:hypothetical protein